jgi:hypothetical protein
MESSIKSKVRKIQEAEERHRQLMQYASIDFSGGKQRYDEKAFYNNHRFKKDAQPAYYGSYTLENLGTSATNKYSYIQSSPKDNYR